MRTGRIVVGVVLLTLPLVGCKEATQEEAAGYEPATLETVDGSDVGRVVLTEDAADRIDLTTAAVEASPDGSTVIPHAAVFYGTDGDTWTYTSVEPLTFERRHIAVDHIDADRAYLTDGPPVGTEVVTVGATELFGVETEGAG